MSDFIGRKGEILYCVPINTSPTPNTKQQASLMYIRKGLMDFYLVYSCIVPVAGVTEKLNGPSYDWYIFFEV